METSDESYEKTVASVERALSLLNAFGPGCPELSLTALAARAHLSKTTALRLAATLERFGYLVRSLGGYRIGPRPLALAALYQHGTHDAEVVLPALHEIVARTEESAAFMVRTGDAWMCLYRASSPHSVRVHLVPGDVVPLERGAAGKILLAFSQPFDPAFARIRRERIAVTDSEVRAEVRTASAPVFEANHRLGGAVCVSGPAYRFTPAAVAQAVPVLLAAAKTITLGMGGDAALLDPDPPAERPRGRLRKG